MVKDLVENPVLFLKGQNSDCRHRNQAKEALEKSSRTSRGDRGMVAYLRCGGHSDHRRFDGVSPYRCHSRSNGYGSVSSAGWGAVIRRLTLAIVWLLGSDVLQAADSSSMDWSAFLGPFHVVALHYPIGFLTLAFLLELGSIWRPREVPTRLISAVLGLTTIAACVAAGLGLLRATGAEFDPELLSDHRFFGLTVAVLVTVACAIQWRAQKSTGQVLWRTYRGVLLLSMGCLVTAGHQGGSLTHGSTFLTQNVPTFLGGPDKSKSLPSTSQSGATTNAYAAVVQPALERKCYSCHGPEKQKGKLRLDSAEAIRSGGKSGLPIVVPGEVGKSRLAQVILLPRTDDDVMPPDGKEPLSDSETLAIIRWIQGGAEFGAKLSN